MRRLLIPLLLTCVFPFLLWSQQDRQKQTPQEQPQQQLPPDLRNTDTTFPGDRSGTGGDSSSMDHRIDVSPPPNDTTEHPESTPDPNAPYEVHSNKELKDNTGVGEFKPFDPHKSQKAVEVGDYYFKRKNYRAAESRYREALYWKDNDAIATFRLAQALEKLGQTDEAVEEYEAYLKILPHGPEAQEVKKSLDRLKGPAKTSQLKK